MRAPRLVLILGQRTKLCARAAMALHGGAREPLQRRLPIRRRKVRAQCQQCRAPGSRFAIAMIQCLCKQPQTLRRQQRRPITGRQAQTQQALAMQVTVSRAPCKAIDGLVEIRGGVTSGGCKNLRMR